MANCPNCGSSDIQIKTDAQNINWGRAITGWALFGIVGGAVGAVTGKTKKITANVCLNCGTVWDAATLYNLLRHIESITKVKLDLSLDRDRERMNFFISHIQPIVQEMESFNSLPKQPKLPKSQVLKISCLIAGAILISGSIWAGAIAKRGGSDAAIFWMIAIFSAFFGLSLIIPFTPIFSQESVRAKISQYQQTLDEKITEFVNYP